MHLGLHLPQLDLDGRGRSLSRLTRATTAAREAGFGSVCANDHLVFSRPWLDCLVALTAVVGASGGPGAGHDRRRAPHCATRPSSRRRWPTST